MSLLSFALSAEAVVKTRDILVCLSRFSEVVNIDASADCLTLSALNSSRTSFASFALDHEVFFQTYSFATRPSGNFSCQVFNKTFFSIFKTRGSDSRDQDTSIERCEISVQEDVDQTECRLVARLLCMHGVKKTFKLTYEPTQTLYPAFNARTSHNTWSIGAQPLRALSEHLGPRTEHLDFFFDAGRLLLTGYTEKIARGSEILKQPLQTTITIDRLDFEDFNVQEHVHVGISVKDFKAIIAHADTLKAVVTASYSMPKKPLRLSYSDGGIQCSFTLVTISEYLGNTVKTANPAPVNAMPPPKSRGSLARAAPENLQMAATTTMPAPAQPASRSFSRDTNNHSVDRPSPPPPQASINQESLFLADDDDDDDDRRWGPGEYTVDADTVRWDSGSNLPTRTTLSVQDGSRTSMYTDNSAIDENEVPPTQRMSQIRGLFDD